MHSAGSSGSMLVSHYVKSWHKIIRYTVLNQVTGKHHVRTGRLGQGGGRTKIKNRNLILGVNWAQKSIPTTPKGIQAIFVEL